MGKIFELSKKFSPWIAQKFGLQPTFVTCLMIVLGTMCYFTYSIKTSFESQNTLLIDQIQATNNIIKEINSKVTEHENRLVVLESTLKNHSDESNADRLKVTEALTRLDAKLDMVTYDVRQLSSIQMRHK